VSDTQPNTGATARWTPEEDAQLTSAVANSCKNIRGKQNQIDWVAVAVLVSGRTKKQCIRRWNHVSDHSIDRANERTGKWSGEEDNTLKGAAQRYGGKNWGAVAALVPGRTRPQCFNRWLCALDPNLKPATGRISIDPTTACRGNWEEDEIIKLKNAVQMHGGKSWDKIALLVPGRTRVQCWNQWKKDLIVVQSG
jgi:hypothetical protein